MLNHGDFPDTYKSYDDSNIDDKEQVRDLGMMMSYTATFTLYSLNSCVWRNIV